MYKMHMQRVHNGKLHALLRAVHLPSLLLDLHPGWPSLRSQSFQHQGGTIADPITRSKGANLSVSLKDGIWLWHRFGLNIGGNALSWLVVRQGMDKKSAIQYLETFSGTKLEMFPESTQYTQVISKSKLEELQDANQKILAIPLTRLAYEQKFFGAIGQPSIAAEELVARGLQDSPLSLYAYHTERVLKDGRLTVREQSLVFALKNPAGEIVGLKARNRGSKEELLALGLGRYKLVAGSGQPAWLSPDFGSDKVELLVEGEFNAMVAWWALREAGHRIDVQGLGGTNGWPYWRTDCEQRFLYLDNDEAGRIASDKLQALYLENNQSARLIAPLPEGTDFCDFAQQHGRAALAELLIQSMRPPVAQASLPANGITQRIKSWWNAPLKQLLQEIMAAPEQHRNGRVLPTSLDGNELFLRPWLVRERLALELAHQGVITSEAPFEAQRLLEHMDLL